MEKGCVPSKHYDGMRPDVLMQACERGQLDLVEKLIEDHHWGITGSKLLYTHFQKLFDTFKDHVVVFVSYSSWLVHITEYCKYCYIIS